MTYGMAYTSNIIYSSITSDGQAHSHLLSSKRYPSSLTTFHYLPLLLLSSYRRTSTVD